MTTTITTNNAMEHKRITDDLINANFTAISKKGNITTYYNKNIDATVIVKQIA